MGSVQLLPSFVFVYSPVAVQAPLERKLDLRCGLLVLIYIMNYLDRNDLAAAAREEDGVWGIWCRAVERREVEILYLHVWCDNCSTVLWHKTCKVG